MTGKDGNASARKLSAFVFVLVSVGMTLADSITLPFLDPYIRFEQENLVQLVMTFLSAALASLGISTWQNIKEKEVESHK